jgi:hypothetical protein
MAFEPRVVGPDDAPPAAPPVTLVEATERSRREFLVMARKKIASEIDAGVPSHALGRLIAEMDRLDVEIRRMDAAERQEMERRGSSERERRSFNSAAI